jgi:hypothetical protein
MQRGTRKHLRVSSQEAAARLACSRGSGGPGRVRPLVAPLVAALQQSAHCIEGIGTIYCATQH